jgi:cytochrome c-type biogenesis protein
MSEELPLFLVFAAGLLSFLSPCVLPLIPSYLSILGGVGIETGQSSFSFQPRLLRAAAGFILGFSAVFITLGILVSTTFSLMGGITRYINWAAGIIVIVLGLNVIFDFLSFLNFEKRPLFQSRMLRIRRTQGIRGERSLPGVPSAFIAGAAFGAGWTPCIGPILTGILLMAGQGGKTGIAIGYLALYSAGLALPFLLAALFFDSFLKHGSRLRSHLPLIRRISGILLIIIGLMILSGRYSEMNILIQKQVFSYISWSQTRAFPFRLLGHALTWLQKY